MHNAFPKKGMGIQKNLVLTVLKSGQEFKSVNFLLLEMVNAAKIFATILWF